ncbi:MAG: hypothetical protein IPM83_03520 [Ignavibacteria bacterium]|nr:hypothetical protein [Ignavibacteria bacterium]
MDDLYAILRISPSASASEIESRLSSVSAYEATRIRAILLVEARRKAYDKAHQAMMRTSILRYALRVTNTANWPQSLQQRWLGDPISKKDHSNSITGRKTRRYPSILKKVKEALKFLVALALFVLLGAAAINLVVKGCSNSWELIKRQQNRCIGMLHLTYQQLLSPPQMPSHHQKTCRIRYLDRGVALCSRGEATA